MISLRPIFLAVGFFLIALAGMMLIPMTIDLCVYSDHWHDFVISIAITAFFGILMVIGSKSSDSFTMTVRETFLLTAISWIIISIFATIPFILCNPDGSYTDAFFEAISGLTTTGSTVISGLNITSYGILVWRSLLQWFGGIGIIVMAFTVMPVLKIGGIQLLHSEFSDRSEKIMPRVSQIAAAIVSTYILFTILCILGLFLAGMEFIDAMCHGLTTISTGGFSTADTSIAYFQNPVVEFIICVFMLVSSITLILFVKMMHGDYKAVWQDSQVRAFLAVISICIVVITLWRFYNENITLLHSFRESAFNTISIISTTGYSSTDYNLWGTFPVMLLFILMMVGGCTGSTSGSIKIFRYQIIFSIVKSYLEQVRRPNGVFTPKYNNKSIPESVSTSVLTFFGIYILSFAFVCLGLSMYDLDLVTVLSASASALNNIGPGLGQYIGPSGSFLLLPDGAKWILMGGMILGRLEYITFIILFLPSFWKN